MTQILLISVILSAAVVFSPRAAFAQTIYTITNIQSHIQGSIRYSLIGKYVAHFEKFSGQIIFDPKKSTYNSVNLKIEAKSLKSKFPTLDRIVLSSRLLNARKFPWITFVSSSIERIEGNEYKVKGKATLHGITKELQFSFLITQLGINEHGQRYLKAQGKWVMARKDFDVIWNKVLDQGGVIVGDHVTLDWTMTAVASK